MQSFGSALVRRFSFALIMAVASVARAQEAPHEASHEAPKAGNLVDELFIGEKLYVQEKNEWYIILEGAFAKNSDEKEYELAAEVRYSLTDQVQLTLEAPYVVVDDDGDTHHGVGDISLAVNYNFIEREDFTLAARVAAAIPTGDEDRDLGAGQFAWQADLLAAVRIERGELYAGVGGNFGDDTDHFVYSLAGAYPIVDRVAGILELSGLSGGHADVAYLTPGISWEGGSNWGVQFGVPIGLTDDSDDFLVIAKLILEY